MVQGMSYLQLYYNKACTRELEKDNSGNYIFKPNNISNSAVMPILINLWCKNNGSHTAYKTSLQLISSDPTVTMPQSKDKIYSNEVVAFVVQINIPKNDNTKKEIIMRFSYDSV